MREDDRAMSGNIIVAVLSCICGSFGSRIDTPFTNEPAAVEDICRGENNY